jgi:sugar phosphate isomerase/epimerase
MRDSLSLAEDLRAKVCVFHLWNTREPEFDVNRLQTTFSDVAASFSEVKASVENIPTHLKDQTPFSLVSLFRYVTLDLRWAAFYDELNRFEILGDRIVNVHLRGSLRGNRWVLTRSPFSFDEALDTIKNRWKYPGLLTVEPEGSIDSPRFNTFIEAMRFLKT